MRRLVQGLVGLVAAAAIAVGVVGWAQYVRQHSSEASRDLAVVDASATAKVQGQVSQALEQVLSYTYSDPATTEAAADRVLAGDARKEYDTLFAALQKQAPGQKLVLTARVAGVAVRTLSDDRATLLVFVDQSSRRAKDEDAAVSAAQLAVTAKRSGETWTITGLKPL